MTSTLKFRYQRLSAHYIDAIQNNVLLPGDALPSLRKLMQVHDVSLSTASEACRSLESQGWVEARARSGFFVRHRARIETTLREPDSLQKPDTAQFIGIHSKISEFHVKKQRSPITINLAGARAEASLYPSDALQKAAIRCLRRHKAILTTMGHHTGSRHFKAALTKRAFQQGLIFAPDDLIITRGASEGVMLALRAVAKSGDTIAVESPAYYGLLQMLESLGLRALEIPTSPTSGMLPRALEQALRTHAGVKAVVVVPHLQNPTGAIMPAAHQLDLLEICKTLGVVVIEDAVYTDLIETDACQHTIKSLDQDGNVIFCASFTKVLAPGLRIGWMHPGKWQARIDMLKQAQLQEADEWPQLALAEIIGTGIFDRHLKRLRNQLNKQRQQYAASIICNFPAGTRLGLATGGTLLWVELPPKCSSWEIFEKALREKIAVAPGAIFSNSKQFDRFLRINCGAAFSKEIEIAIRRLGDIVKQSITQT